MNDLDGLGPGPQPGHVDVRIAYRSNGELLQPWIKRLQFLLRKAQRIVEAGLIPMIQGSEADRGHSCVNLRFMLGFAVRISHDYRKRGENFVVQQPRVGTDWSRLKQQAAGCDSRWDRLSVYADRDQELLSGRRALR